MSADPPVDDRPPLRADARRNRDQIIGAAKAIFAAHDPETVPMEEVARRARVGVGTLYRRFPDRTALVRAVVLDNFARALAEADAAGVEEPTAWDALVRLLRTSAELDLSVRLAVLSPRTWAALRADPDALELRDRVLAAIDALVLAAQAEGALRADVGAGDVIRLFSLLLRRPLCEDVEPAPFACERTLAVALDGLRARGGGLPGESLTTADVLPR